MQILRVCLSKLHADGLKISLHKKISSGGDTETPIPRHCTYWMRLIFQHTNHTLAFSRPAWNLIKSVVHPCIYLSLFLYYKCAVVIQVQWLWVIFICQFYWFSTWDTKSASFLRLRHLPGWLDYIFTSEKYPLNTLWHACGCSTNDSSVFLAIYAK